MRLFLDLQNLVLIIDQIRGEDLGKKNLGSRSGDRPSSGAPSVSILRLYVSKYAGVPIPAKTRTRTQGKGVSAG
jgi:hypothetical protein